VSRLAGERLRDAQDFLSWADSVTLGEMMRHAAALRDEGFGTTMTWSRKVFIPLTELCRDVCHYCTFAKSPRRVGNAYMSPDEVLAVAREGARAGCREALFTLGDKPELRYRAARAALEALGYSSTVEYVAAMAAMVREQTGLLPHVNCGVLEPDELALLRTVAPSVGLMLETSAARLSARGGPHFGSPDKLPERRLACLAAAGELAIPVTSGILVGIGESRRERVQSLLDLRDLAERHGHIQEVIVQNFVPKPDTAMRDAPAPAGDEVLWSVAMARLVLGAEMSLQAPPNLNPARIEALIAAGINDWGGISPVTPDHVNPESPWPHIDTLARRTGAAGRHLAERLTVYPRYVVASRRWIDPQLAPAVLRLADSEGLAREDGWHAGEADAEPVRPRTTQRPDLRPGVAALCERAAEGRRLSEAEIVRLFAARGADFDTICDAADTLRRQVNGESVSYVVNRNINYTNVCTYRCGFCAFSKGRSAASLRGPAYVLDLAEIGRRTEEAWQRGATEVCLQGGIHPAYTGDTYLAICRAVREAAPAIHVHGFSPLEVVHGARTLGIGIEAFLTRLREAGLASLPGTAAEILDDRIRARICPDKIDTEGWLEVMACAHRAGLTSTSTIMFGHVEQPASWAIHLLALRDLAERSRGFTEFVPLPFVHREAPLYRRGLARPGPTLRETMLMHAVGRLVLHPHIRNVQVSWTKLGAAGARLCLDAGANDLGGTLMNESISRAAGASHGQEMSPAAMVELIETAGRRPRQRNTDYSDADPDRAASAHAAVPLLPAQERAASRYRGEY